jgi:hypothetical protein
VGNREIAHIYNMVGFIDASGKRLTVIFGIVIDSVRSAAAANISGGSRKTETLASCVFASSANGPSISRVEQHRSYVAVCYHWLGH